MKFGSIFSYPAFRLVLAASAVVLFNACGSGAGSSSTQSSPAVGTASGVTTLHMDTPSISLEAAQLVLKPSFHVAPVLLDQPDFEDAIDNAASSRHAPGIHYVPAEFQNLSTRRLTKQIMTSVRQSQWTGANTTFNPAASTAAVTTYTPAQIRAAYGLPGLPTNTGSLSAAQAAALGAGQTIYLIDAMNDPNVVAELAAFNQSFGLPGCATTVIPGNTKLPLAAASSNGCQFSVVYNTDAGALTSTAPAFDSGWATEIALDVQWAHATAPFARIILIEAGSASSNSLIGAISLANAMGPGAVSMSFGGSEGSWTGSVDSVFGAANMTYLAATGDSGAGVQWPAVSSHVLAVGGTTLNYSGSGSRSETAWANGGGGISAYIGKPAYQNNSVPDMGAQSTRAVADVSFNANPNTGQYLAVISPGTSSVSWLSAGGTSLSTPQWAGVIAIANAQRALTAKAALGAPHAALYNQISSVPGSYSAAFLDVTQGSDGSCSSCSARAGYDEVTGLGTPNVSGLLNLLTGASNNPPVVTPAGISGVVGTALTFTASVTGPDPVTFSLSGQPTGMTISSAGAIIWPVPVVGSYAVTVTAKDTKTGLSGSGLYTVTITNPGQPVVNSQSIGGKAGTALSFTVSMGSTNAVSFSLSKQPAGMTISGQGGVTWPTPVTGTYVVTVVAKDLKTGLTGSGVYTVTIAAAVPPAVSGANISGTVGTTLSFSVTVTAPNPVAFTLAGAPPGMVINGAGLVSWIAPIAGAYVITVVAKNTVTGLSGSGVYSVSISANGPTVSAAPMTGKVGQSLSGTIIISDKNAASLNISISGVPMGMSFTVSGLTITATWPNPLVGTYLMKLNVVDSNGLSTQASVPITVTAR
ncbi:hypothetical protein AAKU67_003777 [Oxalobacteraceae bacterium GrIS 2.11]